MYLLDTTDNSKLILIQQNSRENTLQEKCKELLSLWKRTTSNPKWEQVIQALRKVNLNYIATKLETAIVVECVQSVSEQRLKQGQIFACYYDYGPTFEKSCIHVPYRIPHI